MTDKLRKYVLPNIPYVFIGWVFLNALISNTKGESKEGDPFWTSATRSLTVKSQRTNNKIPLFG